MFDEFGIGSTGLPAADIYETEKEYAFELEVPGFQEKELSIEVLGGSSGTAQPLVFDFCKKGTLRPGKTVPQGSCEVAP